MSEKLDDVWFTRNYLTFDAPRHGTLVLSPNDNGGSIAEWSF